MQYTHTRACVTEFFYTFLIFILFVIQPIEMKVKEWDLCDISMVYIISKFVNYGSLTRKIEAHSVE